MVNVSLSYALYPKRYAGQNMQITPILLTTRQAAEFLSIGKSELDRARILGVLSGIEPPPFIRMGKRVRYAASDLIAWADNFKRQTTVAAEDCA